MNERYRLIFRGELLDGQHPAVVRRKLGQLLALDEARLDRLFSGQAVVVKAEADAESAERFEQLFRKAGARLSVGPAPPAGAAVPAHPGPAVAEESPAGPDTAETPSAPVPSAPAPSAGTDSADAAGAAPGFAPEILPVGSDVLREDEREPWEPRDIDTAHLSLQAPDAPLPEPPPGPPPPDTSKFRLIDP
jgi:Tfp pilus assembly protein FimV